MALPRPFDRLRLLRPFSPLFANSPFLEFLAMFFDLRSLYISYFVCLFVCLYRFVLFCLHRLPITFI